MSLVKLRLAAIPAKRKLMLCSLICFFLTIIVATFIGFIEITGCRVSFFSKDQSGFHVFYILLGKEYQAAFMQLIEIVGVCIVVLAIVLAVFINFIRTEMNYTQELPLEDF